MNFRRAGLPTRARKSDSVELLTNEVIIEFFSLNPYKFYFPYATLLMATFHRLCCRSRAFLMTLECPRTRIFHFKV